MRYLLAQNQAPEIPARCEYLFDVFHLYFLPQEELNGFIPLVPLGTADLSVLFIVGHHDQVMNFLKKSAELITEDTIVLITCMANTFKSYRKLKKKIYYSTADNNFSYRYSGQDYGFGFDITESELDFYNSSKKDIFQRLDDSFQHL